MGCVRSARHPAGWDSGRAGLRKPAGGDIQGAAWDGRYFYFLTQDQIHLLDNRFSPVDVIPVEGATGIEVGQGLIFAGFPDRIEVYTFEANSLTSLVSSLPLPDLNRVFLPPVLQRLRTLLALQESGGAQLLDYSHPEVPAILATYAKTPWFASAYRFGDLLTLVDPDSMGLELFKLTRPQSTMLDSNPVSG